MESEIINTATGTVSATMAVVSTILLVRGKTARQVAARKRPLAPKKKAVARPERISLHTILITIIASSGWALCCLSYLWIFEPYGPTASKREIRQFYGIIIAFPSIMAMSIGLKLLWDRFNLLSKR